MKILVVMGSPRKGEGYAAVKQVEAQMVACAAENANTIEFDYLWLKEVHYGACSGCHACIRFGEEKCPLRDDRAAVEARILAADGVIFVTPVYSNQVSYLMKTFIDRFSYLWHRPRFFGKFAMGIASGGGQFKATLGYLKECSTAWGMSWVTELGAAHADALVPRMRANLERDTLKTATRFYQAVQSNRVPAPGLMDLLRFRMWRINATACKQFIPADFKHWTTMGWFQADYYTGVKISPLKRAFSIGMEGLMRRFLRSVYVGY